MLSALILLTLAVTSGPPQPVTINDRTLYTQLYNAGYPDADIQKVRRNSAGTRLYLYPFSKDAEILVVQGGRVVRTLRRPGEVAYLNDEEQFVAWTNDLKKGVNFINGGHRDVPFMGSIDVDPGGQYFVISAPKTSAVTDAKGPSVVIGVGTSQIAAIAHPMRVLATAPLNTERIFQHDNKIYLIGSRQDDSFVCQTYEIGADSAYLIGEHIISAPTRAYDMGVYDMDPATKRLLAWRHG